MVEQYKILILKHILNPGYTHGIREIDLLGDYSKSVHDTALYELIRDGLIKNTNSGYKIEQSGNAYLTRLELNELPNDEPLIHVGHNITGDIHRSDLSIDNSRDKETISNKTLNPNTKKSSFEWFCIIVSVIGSIIGIYWFFTK